MDTVRQVIHCTKTLVPHTYSLVDFVSHLEDVGSLVAAVAFQYTTQMCDSVHCLHEIGGTFASGMNSTGTSALDAGHKFSLTCSVR